MFLNVGLVTRVFLKVPPDDELTRTLEVVGSNTPGFFLLLSLHTFLHQWSVLNKVPQKEVHLQLCVVK